MDKLNQFETLRYVRNVEAELAEGRILGYSSAKLDALEKGVQDAYAQISGMSDQELRAGSYLTQLEVERQALKDRYQAEKSKVEDNSQKAVLLSQYRSNLALNQNKMERVKAVFNKSYDDIFSNDKSSVDAKLKETEALFTLYGDVEGAMKQLDELQTYVTKNNIKITKGGRKIYNSLKAKVDSARDEIEIDYREALLDSCSEIVGKLNDLKQDSPTECVDSLNELVDNFGSDADKKRSLAVDEDDTAEESLRMIRKEDFLPLIYGRFGSQVEDEDDTVEESLRQIKNEDYLPLVHGQFGSQIEGEDNAESSLNDLIKKALSLRPEILEASYRVVEPALSANDNVSKKEKEEPVCLSGSRLEAQVVIPLEKAGSVVPETKKKKGLLSSIYTSAAALVVGTSIAVAGYFGMESNSSDLAVEYNSKPTVQAAGTAAKKEVEQRPVFNSDFRAEQEQKVAEMAKAKAPKMTIDQKVQQISKNLQNSDEDIYEEFSIPDITFREIPLEDIYADLGSEPEDIYAGLDNDNGSEEFYEDLASRKEVTIKNGDTVWNLCGKSPACIKEVSRMNPQVKNLNKIYSGQKMDLPAELVKSKAPELEDIYWEL
ncbi:MAG: hypothetical protein KKA62_00020 [Nanoarchaeota archaeon]|nr:hypothetical protein [Nanoarchaeota archaeon]MBU1643839.1 hypothetical protein [Nanoarchaeota archaeon]MBU1976322.1 hypothetical protein [Nanoarchaeota archaeon]